MNGTIDEGGLGGTPARPRNPGWTLVALGWSQEAPGKWTRYLFRRRKGTTEKPVYTRLHYVDSRQPLCLFCLSQQVTPENLPKGRTGARCLECGHLTYFTEG